MCEVATADAFVQGNQALALLNTGAYQEAEPLLRAAVDRMRGQVDDQGREISGLLVWSKRLMESLVEQGKFAEAETVGKKTLRTFEERWGLADEDVLDVKCLLAESLWELKKPRDAAPIANAALEGFESNLKRGPEHHMTLKCRALCAVLLDKLGRMRESKDLLQSARAGAAAAEERAETRFAQGGRRQSDSERRGYLKVEAILGKLPVRRTSLGDIVRQRMMTKGTTVSTEEGETESEYASTLAAESRRPSKCSVVSGC
uniref:MalT-like TPR region domain-containing protein n=1 Tax=Zooxanthella nutricula TaxID=1333877 RepID=A0A7S2J3K3_9DINO